MVQTKQRMNTVGSKAFVAQMTKVFKAVKGNRLERFFIGEMLMQLTKR